MAIVCCASLSCISDGFTSITEEGACERGPGLAVKCVHHSRSMAIRQPVS